jgi:hypothetical protein
MTDTPKGYMAQIAVSPQVQKRVYDLKNCFVCSYTRVLELREAMNLRPEDQRSRIRSNAAVPHNTVYYIDVAGKATKFFLSNEGVADE